MNECLAYQHFYISYMAVNTCYNESWNSYYSRPLKGVGTTAILNDKIKYLYQY